MISAAYFSPSLSNPKYRTTPPKTNEPINMSKTIIGWLLRTLKMPVKINLIQNTPESTKKKVRKKNMF
mgnify:CR=1 FL=1